MLSAVLDLKERNDKFLGALVDLKNAIVSNARLQALHWEITHVKTSQPQDETAGNFTSISELQDHDGIRVLINSKDLMLKILLSFVQGLSHIVQGYTGIVAEPWGGYNKQQSDDAKARASAQYQKKL